MDGYRTYALGHIGNSRLVSMQAVARLKPVPRRLGCRAPPDGTSSVAFPMGTRSAPITCSVSILAFCSLFKVSHLASNATKGFWGLGYTSPASRLHQVAVLSHKTFTTTAGAVNFAQTLHNIPSFFKSIAFPAK